MKSEDHLLYEVAFKMVIIENPKPSKPSFRQKPESGASKHFWIPASAGVTFRTTLVESQSWYFLERNLVLVHRESLLKWTDELSVPRPIHNGKNNLPVAPHEVLLECPMEQRGDLTAIVAECSTAPCPEDNGIVGMLHPNGQNFEYT